MKKFIPLLVLLLAVAYFARAFAPQKSAAGFDVTAFGRLPVLVNGRIKPFDTVARTSLVVLQGRQLIKTPSGQKLSPDEWLLDVLFRPELADNYQHFEITHPDVLALFGLTDTQGDGGKRFSFAQIFPKIEELERQGKLAEQVEPPLRNSFQKAVVGLRQNVVLYYRLKHSLVSPDSKSFLDDLDAFARAVPAGVEAVRARQAGQPHDEAAAKTLIDAASDFALMAENSYLRAIPPAPQAPDLTAWKNSGEALTETFQTGRINPNVLAYAGLAHAWRLSQPEQFNTIVSLYRDTLKGRFATQLKKGDAEVRFNAAEPFYNSIGIYGLVIVLALISWLRWPDVLQKSAFYLLALLWVVTTAGIAVRMWLEGRPPVTNLYSSALFIGWGAVGLCLLLERIYRNSIGNVAGGMIGFALMLIAHHLSLDGDTLEMMRAVLDSNFWLATHVVVVTMGYAATYLAGALAVIYIFRGLFTTTLDKPTADALARMVYGIICFATLFSFVGTILGGIWADQSWGRFWGWDPKENGALIIVLWNAIILHCRWGGLVKQRGLMTLAVVGNIVTSWSYFGTNLLGVGLHSYGFTNEGAVTLYSFIAAQLVIIGLANIPLAHWRSFQARIA